MAFDPQAYIKAKQAAVSQPPAEQPVFDPQRYLASKQSQPPAEDISKLQSFGRGLLQGVTFDTADEITGALESAAGSLGLTDVNKTYQQARDESRANFKAAEEANPLSSMAGNIAGSVATAALPIPGLQLAATAGKTGLAGSKVVQAGILGSKLGALNAAGQSEADSLGGMAQDVAKGAVTGGVLGAGTDLATQGVGAAYRAGKSYLHNAFEPTIQRLKALGVSKTALKNAGGIEKVVGGVEEAAQRGVFDQVNGHAPTPPQMFGKIDELMDTDFANMKARIQDPQLADVPFDTLEKSFLHPLAEKLDQAGDLSDLQHVLPKFKAITSDMVRSEGNIEELWRLKKIYGGKVNWGERALSTQPPIETTMYKEATGLLDQAIVDHLSQVETEAGGTLGQEFSQFKKSYANLSKVWPMAKQAADDFVLNGDKGATLRVKDQLTAAGIGAGLGAITGIPGVGAAAGLVGAIGGAAARSVPGHLARAKIGDMAGLTVQGLQQKAISDAAAQMQGKIPRSLAGFKEWVTKNMQALSQVPMVGQAVDQIMKSPDPIAEAQIRSLMPMLGAVLAPSPYPSEFNGKVTTPADRITARQVIMAQGLPPSVAAYHASLLNKSGTLQGYHFAAQVSGGPGTSDYGDEILNFNERLTAMGY